MDVHGRGVIDFIVPIRGMRRCVRHYIQDVTSRSCGTLRVLLIRGNSDSKSLTTYRHLTQRSTHVGMVRSTIAKISVTEGLNVRETSKSCLVFTSTSS